MPHPDPRDRRRAEALGAGLVFSPRIRYIVADCHPRAGHGGRQEGRFPPKRGIQKASLAADGSRGQRLVAPWLSLS